jgi:hypothetical protein
VLDIENKSCACCGGDLHVIGEDVAERLDVVPASFRVLVTKRPRYGCRACEAPPVQAAAAPRIVENGLPTEALVAHVRRPSMPTTCRFTARRRSTPGKAFGSTVRRSPTGRAARPGG